jgi:hypothetical protein
VVAAEGQHHLEHPNSFWDVVLGSGYRATVDALGPDQRDRLRERLLGELRSRRVTTLRTDVVFGTATRDGLPASARSPLQTARDQAHAPGLD